jgi:uncharacterized membrane protein YedE/YeeE
MNELATIISAALCGLIFGFGLIASDMIDPARVIAFLDVVGAWDPSLLLVMVAAAVVSAPAFAMARRSSHSWLGEPISLPNRRNIDNALLTGAAIFGVGWGLAGLCPAPGLALLGIFDAGALLFVPAVIVGSFIGRLRPSPAAEAKS